MFENLKLFQMAHGMARHAGQRQALVARNMANADTPGFRPRDLRPFAEIANTSATSTLKTTRARHFGGAATGAVTRGVEVGDSPSSPNGNAVTVEDELLRAVDVKRQHDRALAIYRSSLNILRASIRRN